MTKELKELCLIRWGGIPVDEEWVEISMRGYTGPDPYQPPNRQEILRNEEIKQFLAGKEIEYIY